jgi:hypothetical protein
MIPNQTTVFVQRPGETPEEYERFVNRNHAEDCRQMLRRSEPFWRVWIAA